MSMKVLVIAGVAVALGAGAYVGGVAYTKSTGESLAQKNFYKVDEALRDYKIPLKIEDKGSESSGFSSSVHTYELSSKEGGASFPVHVHNSYGLGSVVSTISLDDKIYDGMKLSDQGKAVLKELVSGFKTSYSVVSDKAESEFTLKDGEFPIDDVSIKWKAGKIAVKLDNVSDYPRLSSTEVNFPEFVIDAKSKGGLRIAGVSAFSKNTSSDTGTGESKIDEISFRDGSDMFALKKFASNASVGASANGKKEQYDIDLKMSLDEFKMEQDAAKYDVKDARVQLNLKNLNYSEIKKKCESIGVKTDLDICINQGIAKLDKNEQMSVLVTSLTGETAVTLNLSANLSGANVDLKNNLSFKEGADFSNPMGLITALQLVSDYSVDSAVFVMPQYKLSNLEPVLKAYAADPNASTLTFHVEFKDGKLTVNGKKL